MPGTEGSNLPPPSVVNGFKHFPKSIFENQDSLTDIWVQEGSLKLLFVVDALWREENAVDSIMSSYPGFCCQKTHMRFGLLEFSSIQSWGHLSANQ